MTDPVRVLVNGRAARVCGGRTVPVETLLTEAVREFFAARLPELDGHLSIELNVTGNSSPGAVITGEGDTAERSVWFAPRSLSDLREQQVLLANDTSLGTGWAPESLVEEFARRLVDWLSAPGGFRDAHSWCGSDVKLMAYGCGEDVDVVLCVPQKCRHVPGRTAYEDNRQRVLAECRRVAAETLDVPVRFRVNARDIPVRDELYLTYTGSSIESGDEGVVGRGNRVNGLITPLRPMNIEGASGKNPVYHVGKLYNISARRLAGRLAEVTGSYVEVHMISMTGQRLDRPWRVLIRTAASQPQLDKVLAALRETLDGFPELTREILATGMVLS